MSKPHNATWLSVRVRRGLPVPADTHGWPSLT
jgi:hypothetical protein